MSTPEGSRPSDACPLCETRVVADVERCPACGLHLAGVGGRPVFTQPGFLWTAMGFVVVYLVTLAIVVATT